MGLVGFPGDRWWEEGVRVSTLRWAGKPDGSQAGLVRGEGDALRHAWLEGDGGKPSSFTMMLFPDENPSVDRELSSLSTPPLLYGGTGQNRHPPDILGLNTPQEALHGSWYTTPLAAGLMGTRAHTRPSVSLVLLPTAGCSLGLGHGSQSPESLIQHSVGEGGSPGEQGWQRA